MCQSSSDDPFYYREKARHCLTMAQTASRGDVLAALRELALEFETQAAELEADGAPAAAYSRKRSA